MAAPRTLIDVLVSLVAWFMWMFFVCTPFGGLYYLIKLHMANTAQLRNKTLQGSMFGAISGWVWGGCDLSFAVVDFCPMLIAEASDATFLPGDGTVSCSRFSEFRTAMKNNRIRPEPESLRAEYHSVRHLGQN